MMNTVEEAVKVFGVENQKRMAIEECAELINALAKEARGRGADVVTEIADVTIMMRQLTIIYGRDAVRKEIIRKLLRLKGRIASARQRDRNN